MDKMLNTSKFDSHIINIILIFFTFAGNFKITKYLYFYFSLQNSVMLILSLSSLNSLSIKKKKP